MTTKPESHLHEELVSSVAAYDGRFLKIRNDTVRLPNGNTSTREYVVHPGAVVVIPLLDDGRVLLERQFRYPIGRVTEFPAGKLDPGEDPLACGKRELLEETGYTAAQWAHAGALHLAIAYSTEIIHIFARGLRRAEAAGPGRVPGRDQRPTVGAVRGLRRGEVTDAKTLTCTLWLQNVLSGAWQLDWRDDAAG